MLTFCFVPIGHEADEIVIHAVNIEAARAKLSSYVADVSAWRPSNG